MIALDIAYFENLLLLIGRLQLDRVQHRVELGLSFVNLKDCTFSVYEVSPIAIVRCSK